MHPNSVAGFLNSEVLKYGHGSRCRRMRNEGRHTLQSGIAQRDDTFADFEDAVVV